MMHQDPHQADVEGRLAELILERTGYDVGDLDREASFVELGFDSLFLIQFSMEIKQRFGVKVSFRQLIEDISSIAKLTEHLVAVTERPAAGQSPGGVVPTVDATRHLSANAPDAVPESMPGSKLREESNPSPMSGQPSPSPATASSTEMPLSLPRTLPATLPVAAPSDISLSNVSGVERIILQQNALMAQHLALLQSQSSETGTVDPALGVDGIPIQNSQISDVPPTPSSDDGGAPSGCVPETPPTALSEGVELSPPKQRFGPYKPVRRGPGRGLTDQQQQHLTGFIERYIRRTAKSRTHAETHREHFADPRGVAGYRRIWKSMVYQIAVERSQGSKLWDIDGNQYVDIAMGFGVNLFGQSPEFVTRALHQQLDRGVEVGPQSPIAGEVAQLLCDFARKDRVTFCNTGSEAVMAAMRLARTVTGKSKVVYFNKDYHGNFDQVLVRSSRIGSNYVSTPAAPGIPQSDAQNMIVLDYGTPEALRIIEQRADEIAAVLIEPVQSADPFLQPRHFLHEVRRITNEHNIAMIMDEVITGFRAAQGGAQEWFDVWADMSTYGKILGGGMPIGALAGTSRYMDALDGGTWRFDDESEPEADMTFFAGTFVRHPLALAAAFQVLHRVKEEGPELQERLSKRTSYLVQTLNTFFEQEQIPIRVAQFASQFRFMFPPDLEYVDMLYYHMLDRGVFTRGWGDNCFLSTEHSDEDVALVIKAVKESCVELRDAGFLPEATENTGSADAQSSDSVEKNNLLKAVTQEQDHVPLESLSQVKPAAQEALGPAISTLVEIQPEGDLTPIFCAPAADGFTRIYHALADHLGCNQPVYGLDSPGIYGLPLPATLEEMAAGLVDEIRAVQPSGPYILIGYCSGGTLALEIAQQLIADGEQVAMLGLIETYNWLDAPSTNPSFLTRMGYGCQRVNFHLRNFLMLSLSDKRQFLAAKMQAVRVRTRVWREKVAAVIRRRKKHPVPAKSVNLADVWKKHDDLAEAYVPRPYPGRLIQFRPHRDYKCHLGSEFQATEGVETIRLRAYPAGTMVEPFVAELADKVTQSLQGSLPSNADRQAAQPIQLTQRQLSTQVEALVRQ